MSFWQIMSVYHSLFHRVEMLISVCVGGEGGHGEGGRLRDKEKEMAALTYL